MNGKRITQGLFILLILILFGCEKSPVHDPLSDSQQEGSNYSPPVYADDYSSMASWETRNLWNLANVHDPTVEKCGEYYYMYTTDASYGNVHLGHGHFHHRRSKDLVNWEYMGASMPYAPAWIRDSLNNMRKREGLLPIDDPVYGFWAPVVRKVGEKYRMYYSVIVDNYIRTGKPNTPDNFDGSWTERAFIGMMETSDLVANSWTDKGFVVCSSTDKELDWNRQSLSDWSGYFKWNAIDPSVIVTPENEQWLIYGSWHSGIVVLQLDPGTGKPLKIPGEPWDINALPDYGRRIARRENSDNNRWQAQEAPEMIYNEKTGYYYLFLAYDELSVAYNTRVCRSRNVTGPFLDYNGANITNGAECMPILTHPYRFNNHSGWVGISHCGVFKDDNGNWFFASQGRLPVNTGGNAYSNAIMMGHVRKIRWTEDGWPVVMPERYAAVPDSEISEDKLIGSWEVIVLKYQYGIQQTSQTLQLNADKTVSGIFSGNWVYNAAMKTLTVGSQKLYVDNGLDWEASPRVATLVFSGINSFAQSVWGKKKR